MKMADKTEELIVGFFNEIYRAIFRLSEFTVCQILEILDCLGLTVRVVIHEYFH